MAGTSDKADEPITSINVTPLVDVCLVLVIIFMAVAPMAVMLGIKVLESRAGAGKGKVAASSNVQIRLTADGKIMVNGVLTSESNIFGEIQKDLMRSKDRMVILTADDANKVGQVVHLLDTAKQAGAVKLAMMKMGAPPKWMTQ